MSEKIRIKDVLDDQQTYLKVTDLENMFNIFRHDSGYYMFNLNETIYFAADTLKLPEITCQYPQFWSTMSYNIYGTTRLAWLLMKLNHVDVDSVLQQIKPGDTVRYLGQEQIQDLIDSLHG